MFWETSLNNYCNDKCRLGFLHATAVAIVCWLETISSISTQFWYHIFLRFDIKGLGPGSEEDEAGIKKASKDREFYYFWFFNINVFIGCVWFHNMFISKNETIICNFIQSDPLIIQM